MQTQNEAKPTMATEAPILLVTAKQAALALAISERKLWQLTNCGEIPSIRIGRAVRYRLSDLESWIQAL